VHRLVALAFVPNPSRLPAAIHVNGNPTDNRPVNLKWCSSESQAFTLSLRPRRKFPQLTVHSRPGGKVDDTADRDSSAGCERVSRTVPPVVREYILHCWHCSHRWPDKVQIATGDTVSSFCPGCGTRNTWSHTAALNRGHRQAQAVCAD
jgi:hypothetical protein